MNKKEHDTSIWKELAHSLGYHSERLLDEARERIEDRFPSNGPIEIVPYLGYAYNGKARVSGRVLRREKRQLNQPSTIWHNIKASYLRFETDEVTDVAVNMTLDGEEFKTVTDKEGYFHFNDISIRVDTDPANTTVTLSVDDDSAECEPTRGTIQCISSKAAYGVISDIDDTIMLTQATSILKMMRQTLLGSPQSRLAFHGVAELYGAFHQNTNPIFYVSSSPWNLYEFLAEFMIVNQIVPGPMHLRDFGIDKNKFIAGPHKDHKLGSIQTILDKTGEMPFVLIGDSGQKDPEIYHEVTQRYPDRVRAIYIRDVSDSFRNRAIQRLSEELAKENIDLLLAPDSLSIAQHAHTLNLISAQSANTVKASITQSHSLG